MTISPTARTPLLEVRGLSVDYGVGQDAVQAVTGANLTLYPGEVAGLAGESGSGKSTFAYAITRLLRAPGVITAGSVRLRLAAGRPGAGSEPDGMIDLLGATEWQLRQIRWSQVAVRTSRKRIATRFAACAFSASWASPCTDSTGTTTTCSPSWSGRSCPKANTASRIVSTATATAAGR